MLDFNKKNNYKKIATFLKKDGVKMASSLIFHIFRYAVLISVSYVAIYPMLKALSVALIDPVDYMGGQIEWITDRPTLMNFKNLGAYFNYWKHAWSTAQYTIGCTLIQMVISSLVGYGLARYKFKGNTLVFICVVITIIVPIQTVQIPLFVYYRYFDFLGIGSLIGLFTGTPVTVSLINTKWSYFVSALFGVGLNSGLFIFLFRQFFKGMPTDLEDAGRVDGCNPLAVYVRIMVPNVRPVFVTVGLLSAIYYWNDYLIAEMFLNNAETPPIMLAVSRIPNLFVNTGSGVTVDSAAYIVQQHAAVLLAVAPLMLIFLICQKFFVECMDRSGIKG